MTSDPSHYTMCSRGQQAGDVICGCGVWEGPGGEQGERAAAAIQSCIRGYV